MNWDSLFSAVVGGLLGTTITSIISYFIFKSQARLESNRIFFSDMLKVLQKIYLSQNYNKPITDIDITLLFSYKVLAIKGFENIQKKIDKVCSVITRYNDGVRVTLAQTGTSHTQVSASGELKDCIDELVKGIKKVT